MDSLEDRLVDRIIDIIVEFRVRYGYGRKLDDPELHERLVTLIRQYASAVQTSLLSEAWNKSVEFSKAVAYLQQTAGNTIDELANIQHGIKRIAQEEEEC